MDLQAFCFARFMYSAETISSSGRRMREISIFRWKPPKERWKLWRRGVCRISPGRQRYVSEAMCDRAPLGILQLATVLYPRNYPRCNGQQILLPPILAVINTVILSSLRDSSIWLCKSDHPIQRNAAIPVAWWFSVSSFRRFVTGAQVIPMSGKKFASWRFLGGIS